MTKKQKILEAAIELFAKQGIEATTIQQITAHSGISKGAFYLSFPSKEALILELIDSSMKSITTNIDQLVNQAQKKKRLHVYFEATFSSLEEYTAFAQILMRENFLLTGEEIWQRMLYYEQLADTLLVRLLTERHGARIEPIVHELVMLVKSFVKSYAVLLFTPGQKLAIEKLSDSLVEKTDILAMYTTKVYLTHPASAGQAQMFTKEKVREELIQVANLQVSTLITESALLAVDELVHDEPRIALLIGMLANLEQESRASWGCYVLRRYIEERQALLSV